MANLAVPIPRTWVPGETEVASYFNALRDALNFLLSPPLAVLVQATAQTTWSGYAPISFDSAIIDTYSGHSVSVNNSRYTAPITGLYTVSGIIAFASNATGVRDALIAKNGINPNYTTTTNNAVGTSTPTSLGVPANHIQLNAGDYVELWGLSGVSGTVAGASVMSVRWAHA